jgi:hypothetical protein
MLATAPVALNLLATAFGAQVLSRYRLPLYEPIVSQTTAKH